MSSENMFSALGKTVEDSHSGTSLEQLAQTKSVSIEHAQNTDNFLNSALESMLPFNLTSEPPRLPELPLLPTNMLFAAEIMSNIASTLPASITEGVSPTSTTIPDSAISNTQQSTTNVASHTQTSLSSNNAHGEEAKVTLGSILESVGQKLISPSNAITSQTSNHGTTEANNSILTQTQGAPNDVHNSTQDSGITKQPAPMIVEEPCIEASTIPLFTQPQVPGSQVAAKGSSLDVTSTAVVTQPAPLLSTSHPHLTSQANSSTVCSVGKPSLPNGLSSQPLIVAPATAKLCEVQPKTVQATVLQSTSKPAPQIKPLSPSIALTVNRSFPKPATAMIGQVTAEILTNFHPPKTSVAIKIEPEPAKPLPTRLSAGEIIASSLAEGRTMRTDTLSLQAHEELVSEAESSEEEMDIAPPQPGPVGGASSRSDSPYADDDSFASFLAREVNETALESSSSRSPTPAIDLLLQTHSSGPGLKRFGVTASCPPAPVQLPDGAVYASLDMTKRNFPKRSKYAHRAAMSAMHPYSRTRGGNASVAKTLDLLKAVLQSSFNMEVKRLCDDYLHIFSQAAVNIHDNTGDNVPDDTLKLLVCKMMEEAQQGYVEGKWDFPYGKLPRCEKVMTPSGSPMSTKKPRAEKSEPRQYKRPRKTERGLEKSVWKWGMDKKRLDPEKWEPDKMNSGTVFCLGVNVNKALGHSANRGKVYYLHPELFKYACDGDDKTWLYENKYLPVHGGKAFLMIFSEVLGLVATDGQYKDSQEVVASVNKLQQFMVPQFMIDKMKTFMKSVQGYFAQEASNNNGPSTSSQAKT